MRATSLLLLAWLKNLALLRAWLLLLSTPKVHNKNVEVAIYCVNCVTAHYISRLKCFGLLLNAESVLARYSNAAPRNLKELEDMGCVILHKVDVHTMRQHPLLVNQLFDRIVFNFPHAGFFFMENQKSQIE